MIFSQKKPLNFPLRRRVRIVIENKTLAQGKHQIQLGIAIQQLGEISFDVEDLIEVGNKPKPIHIPRNEDDDYSNDAIQQRQAFIEQQTQKHLKHVNHFSFPASVVQGNIENFTGVAQIPLGIAGPIHINGEAAQGEFLVPLATTEGTLVASYNRGIKLLNHSGGVNTTVVDDAMQRAPVFVFQSARHARDFVDWVEENLPDIREQAEATSRVAKLRYIAPFLASKFAYLRFNFTTGDAAGQNMVGRATFAACNWIMQAYDQHPIEHFYLESNFATDKKSSQVNILHTRGKRVTAEAVIKREALQEIMRVDPESLHYHGNIATAGAFLSGANNNGAHSPNAITAIFIATGQDVANVAESSAAILYTEITPERDLYVSVTLPSLIVATYGGGTALPTQRECLEIMGCYGKGKVTKLAEIIAGVVLAGELSLGAAISSSDWVSSHEQYGRNR
jgi:hydroxymethylglutaryl-CoA reductase (NADPH)